jgi:hypothetical protein
MDATLKVITQLPLAELWREDGFSTTSRIGWLSAEQIVSQLRAGRVQFVVADIGSAPRWIAFSDCFDFWKREAQPHFAAPDSRVSFDDFPGGYCYFASEWSRADRSIPIVVFERHH